MDRAGMRFRVGLFVLGAMVLLGVLIVGFSSFPSFFTHHTPYTITFDEAPGVTPGTPVRRSGVRVGEVEDVHLDDATGKVRVKIAIAAPHVLRQAEQPVLSHGLLGGEAVIDFTPGEPAAPPDHAPLSPGTELTGKQAADINMLLKQAPELAPSAEETLREIRQSLQHFDHLAPELDQAIRAYQDLARAARELLPEVQRSNEEVLRTSRTWGHLGEHLDGVVQANQEKVTRALDRLNDTLGKVGRAFSDDNLNNLSATLQSARQGTQHLDRLSQSTEDFLKASREAVQHVNASMTRADAVLSTLDQAARPMADRGERVMRNLDESTQKFNVAASDAQALFRSLNQGNGAFQRFSTDPALYNNLNRTAEILNQLLPRLDVILRDLQVFSDKIARHPEVIGVNGVFAPGAGVKEAPRWGR